MEKRLDLVQIRSRIAKLRLDALPWDKPSAQVEVPASVPALPDNPYESAAAVLAWFDPARIRPVETEFGVGDREAQVDELLLASVPTMDEEGMRRWTLAGDRRVQALRALREAGAVEAALSANPGEPGGMLRRGLEGTRLVDETATLSELRAAAAVASTLSQAGFDFSPTHAWINDRIERLTLLAPFEHLAGGRFRGRTTELAKLRGFVGVVPPHSYREAAERVFWGTARAIGRASELFGRTQSFAMAVSGPGGVGKSSLVSRFILEHAQAHAEDRFPFAYLDFDRPDIATDEPVTVLAEAVRQLGIQYPEFRADCERLRLAWLGKLQDNTDRESLRRFVVDEAMHWVLRIGGSDRPFVLVLDTFEEVQYRGEYAVDALFRVLEDLRDKVPKLRIIIAGRAEVEGRAVIPIALSTFDQEAAVAFLRAHGIGSDEVAEKIYSQCGGSPLSLTLAAELVRADPAAVGNLGDKGGLFSFLGRLDDEQIQRQLYQRVLEHIHDAEVRALAHPGLVVRRITPAIIREVLAESCEIEVASLDAAQVLFGKLQREISLVRLEPDGSLRHRADVRQLMIGPLQRDRPEQARRIHEAAVRFYAEGTGDIDLAESIYHRLWLSSLPGREHDLDEIATQWRQAVARHLSGAIAEFLPPQRAFIAARIGVAADPEALAAARQADWETLVARAVQGLMRNARLMEAFEILKGRPARERCSPLFVVEAELLLLLTRRDAALEVMHAALHSMQAAAPGRAEAGPETDFLLDVGKVAIRLQDESLGTEVAKLLDAMLDRKPSRSVRMHASAQLAFLGEFVTGVSPAHAEGLLVQMESANLERLHKEAQWLAAAPGRDLPARVGRFVEAFGVVRVSEPGMRQLGAALGRADVAYSQGLQSRSQGTSTAGELAARHDIPWFRSVTESWSAYVVGTDVAQLGPVISEVLHSLPESGREDLAQAIRRLLCEALGLLDERPAPEQVGTLRGRRPAAPVRHLHRLVDAIAAAFGSDQLHNIMSRRLERSPEAYWSEGPFRRNVLLLVEAAQAQGWLDSLVQALLDARPGDERLAEAAARVGVSSLANDVETKGSIARVVPERERTAWRAKLIQIERATCLVTTGKSSMTGLLVGPDLVLTADFLEFIGAASFDMEFRFGRGNDAASSSDPGYVRGSTFGLARRGVVASGREAGMRYVLLRVDGEPGALPVGNAQAEASAELRRWVELSPRPRVPFPGMPLMVAHFPGGRSLQLSEGRCQSVDPLTYDINTEPGSAGGPVFDATTLEVVGLHLSRQPGSLKAGLAMTDVLADLSDKHLDHLLFSRFA